MLASYTTGSHSPGCIFRGWRPWMFQGSLRRVDADPATPACAWRRERSPNLNRGLEYSVSGLVARESFGSLSVPTGRKVFISWDSTRPEHRFSNLDPGSDLQHRRIAEWSISNIHRPRASVYGWKQSRRCRGRPKPTMHCSEVLRSRGCDKRYLGASVE